MSAAVTDLLIYKGRVAMVEDSGVEPDVLGIGSPRAANLHPPLEPAREPGQLVLRRSLLPRPFLGIGAER